MVGKNKWNFLKWQVLEKSQNTISVRMVEKGIRQHYLFWGQCAFMFFLFCFCKKNVKHYKKSGLQQHRGKPKTHFVLKRVFLEGVSKRIFAICDPQKAVFF